MGAPRSATIGRVVMYVEIERAVSLVVLPEDVQPLLIKLAGGLCEGGTLKLLPQPHLNFTEIERPSR